MLVNGDSNKNDNTNDYELAHPSPKVTRKIQEEELLKSYDYVVSEIKRLEIERDKIAASIVKFYKHNKPWVNSFSKTYGDAKSPLGCFEITQRWTYKLNKDMYEEFKCLIPNDIDCVTTKEVVETKYTVDPKRAEFFNQYVIDYCKSLDKSDPIRTHLKSLIEIQEPKYSVKLIKK